MQAFTIIAKNYVPFARVLARSFLAHHPNARFSVFFVDEWRGYVDPEREPFEALDADRLEIPPFEAMAHRYDVLELATAVKPWVMRHLLQDPHHSATLYLDPDIKVYDSLTELERLAVRHGVAVVPHFTHPIPRDGRRPSELDVLLAGAYNLGFIGMAHTRPTEQLLDWWADRLETGCRVDPSRGFFVDQRWMDLMPGMIDAAIMRDPGYDVAYWNLHYRDVTYSEGIYLVNGSRMRFFHFSGYEPSMPSQLSTHQDRIDVARLPAIRRLCDDYRRELLAAGFHEARSWPYQPRPATRVSARVFPAAPALRFAAGSSDRVPTRSLGRRIVDLENLVEAKRRSGAGNLQVARALLEAVDSKRKVGLRTLINRRPRGSATGHLNTCGVNVIGYLDAELGVGEMARQAIAALEACDIPVHPVSHAAPPGSSRRTSGSARLQSSPYPINLLCVNADMVPTVKRAIGDRFFHDRYTIGLWNWEVQAMPSEHLSAFGLVNEVWAPSQHTAQALRGRSPTEVRQVLLPVVPHPQPAAADPIVDLPLNYTFLFMFDYLSVFERKNPLGVISAFTDAFAPGSGAALLVKSVNADQRLNEHDLLLSRAAHRPDVCIHDGLLSASQKNALLAGCDCYVSLHRAEGFGLTMAEAMYFCRPVIGTAYSGNLDFMTSTNSYLVKHGMTSIGPGVDPYPADGQWAQPDLEHASRLMREVFANRPKAAATGIRAGADIRRTHSPQAAGLTMRPRIRTIFEQRARR